MGTKREKPPVTFHCELCSFVVTEAHGPGPTPRYCHEWREEALR
jgi:hypothetical protein